MPPAGDHAAGLCEPPAHHLPRGAQQALRWVGRAGGQVPRISRASACMALPCLPAASGLALSAKKGRSSVRFEQELSFWIPRSACSSPPATSRLLLPAWSSQLRLLCGALDADEQHCGLPLLPLPHQGRQHLRTGGRTPRPLAAAALRCCSCRAPAMRLPAGSGGLSCWGRHACCPALPPCTARVLVQTGALSRPESCHWAAAAAGGARVRIRQRQLRVCALLCRLRRPC